MGIKGLHSYIIKNFKEWNVVTLRNCPVVLDGNGISYYCGDQVLAELDAKNGGRYHVFRSKLVNFFEALLAQNIKPIHVVMDGVNGKSESEKRKKLRQCLAEAKSCILEGSNSTLLPLMLEVFRKVLEDYKSCGDLKIYTADGEADGVAVTLANQFNCYLVGQDSDFFVYPLQMGYIPLSKLEWSRPRAPIRGEVYKREAFIASLKIQPDLILAIPAIAGNDALPNLVEETSFKYRFRLDIHNPSKDTSKAIELIRNLDTMENLETFITKELYDSERVLEKLRTNYRQAQRIYTEDHPYSLTCSLETRDGKPIPDWLIAQFREYQFDNSLLAVLVTGRYLLHIVPEDFTQPSTKVFSRPIRQAIYGVIFTEENPPGVTEIIREGDDLKDEDISFAKGSITIDQMENVSLEERKRKACAVLQCNKDTLSSLDQKWWLVIASVCFWAKGARIPRDDIRLKALILGFVECYHHGEGYRYQPALHMATHQLYTQWQCVYNDAILLNQVMALPLPYLSPADIFDGTRVTYYSQCKFESLLTQRSGVNRALFQTMLAIINSNII